MDMIIGADWGNYSTNICTPYRVETYPSNIIAWEDEWLDFTPSKYDFIFEFNGRKGIAGQIAFDEATDIDTNKKGDTKFHEDALIRLLVGLHKFTEGSVKVVVGQPIKHHKRDKEMIKEMLIGKHKITVNDETKTIHINDAIVGVEGGSAFLSQPKKGTVHFIDAGSGTINLATVKNGRFINSQSDTISKGMENLKRNPKSIIENIKNITKDLGWLEHESVYLLGGGSHVLKQYTDYELLQPVFNHQLQDPVVANAIGFFRLGERTWG